MKSWLYIVDFSFPSGTNKEFAYFGYMQFSEVERMKHVFFVFFIE